MCYHVKKCAPREIVRTECPLEKNNYIDHYLFTQTNEECKQKYVYIDRYISILIRNINRAQSELFYVTYSQLFLDVKIMENAVITTGIQSTIVQRPYIATYIEAV